MKATITKGIKGTLLAASLLLFGGHAWTSSRGAVAVSKSAQARKLFDERCARCHGSDGRGATRLGEMLEPPDFTDAGWQKSASDERMKNSIKDGVGQMPAFKRKLSSREITSLVAHVRGFARPAR